MDKIASIHKISNLKKSNKEFLFSNFESIAHIIKTSSTQEDVEMRVQDLELINKIINYINKSARGDEEAGIRSLIRGIWFKDYEWNVLYSLVQAEDTSPSLVDAIIKSIITEPKTKEFALSKSDDLIERAILSNTPKLAESLNKNLSLEEDIVKKWHDAHPAFDKETGRDENPPPKIEQERKENKKKEFINLERLLDKRTIQSFLSQSPGSEGEALQKLIDNAGFSERALSTVIEIIIDSNYDQNVANTLLSVLKNNDKTKILFSGQYFQAFVEIAINAEKDILATAIDMTTGSDIHSQWEAKHKGDIQTPELNLNNQENESQKDQEYIDTEETNIADTNEEVSEYTTEQDSQDDSPPVSQPETVTQSPAPITPPVTNSPAPAPSVSPPPPAPKPVNPPAPELVNPPVPEPVIPSDPGIPTAQEPVNTPININEENVSPSISEPSIDVETPQTEGTEEGIDSEVLDESENKETFSEEDPIFILAKRISEKYESLLKILLDDKQDERIIASIEYKLKTLVINEIENSEFKDIDPKKVIEKAKLIFSGGDVFKSEKKKSDINVLFGNLGDGINVENLKDQNLILKNGVSPTVNFNGLIDIPVVLEEREDGATFVKKSVDTSLLSEMFNVFNNISEKGISEKKINEIIYEKFFSSSFKGYIDKNSEIFRNVKNPQIDKETYRFNAAIQADILGLYHRYAISESFGIKATDIIMNVLESSEGVSVEKPSDLFTNDKIQEIISSNIEDGMPEMSPDNVKDKIDENFNKDFTEYYSSFRKVNKEISLQAEIIAIDQSKMGTKMKTFCTTCGRFRQGGSLPKCKNATLDRNLSNLFIVDEDGVLKWKNPIPPKDPEELMAYEQWSESNGGSTMDPDSPTVLSEDEKKRLSPESIEMLERGCKISFENGKVKMGCNFVDNHFSMGKNSGISIKERMRLTEVLTINGKPLTLSFNKDGSNPVEVKSSVLGKKLLDSHLESLSNIALENGIETIVPTTEWDLPPKTVSEALELYLTRMYKHTFYSWENAENRSKSVYPVSPGNPTKIGEVTQMTDFEVIESLAKPIFDLFLMAESKKIKEREDIDELFYKYINDKHVQYMISKEFPELSEEELKKKWIEEKAIRGAMRSYCAFKPNSIPGDTFLKSITQSPEINEAFESEEFFLWYNYLCQFGAIKDAEMVTKGVVFPEIFSRRSTKILNNRLYKELEEIVLKSQTMDLSEEETDLVKSSIMGSFIADCVVGLPAIPEKDKEDSIESYVRSAIIRYKKDNNKENSNLSKEEEKEIKKEAFVEYYRKKSSDIENITPEMLEAWNLPGVGLNSDKLRELTKIVINQMLTIPVTGVVKTGMGTFGKMSKKLKQFHEENDTEFLLEGPTDSNLKYKKVSNTSEKILEMIRKKIIQDKNIVQGIESGALQNYQQGSEEYNNSIISGWRDYIYNNIYPLFDEYFEGVNEDMFFDALVMVINSYQSAIGEDAVSENLGIPKNVISSIISDRILLSDGMYTYDLDKDVSFIPEDGGAKRRLRETGYTVGSMPGNIWFLKQYLIKSRLNLESDGIILEIVKEIRKMVNSSIGVRRENLSISQDDETAKQYVKARIQNDFKKILKPQESIVPGSGDIGEQIMAKIKILPENLKEQLQKILIENSDANSTLFDTINTEIEQFMPKKPLEKNVHGFKIKDKMTNENKEALEKTFPVDIDDFEKAVNLPEEVSDVFLDIKKSHPGGYFSRKIRQMVSYFSLPYMLRMDQTEASEKDEVLNRLVKENISDHAIHIIHANWYRGQLTERNSSYTDWSDPSRKQKSINYYALGPLREEMSKMMGSNLSEAIEWTKGVGVKANIYNNWYKTAIKITNEENVPKIVKKEFKKFNWYKTAKDLKNSNYEAVLIYSYVDMRMIKENLQNKISKDAKTTMPIFLVVPYDSFGSLSNIHKFNVESDLYAHALTRKECDILRRMNLMG